MGFKIKVNGLVVHELDIDPRQVTGVALHTAAGEATVGGLDFNEDSVNLEIKYQLDNALPIIEDNARLAKAEAVQNGEVNEQLFSNENARRIEALKALDEDQAERAKNSDEDLSLQFAEERQAVIEDSTITAQHIQDNTHPSRQNVSDEVVDTSGTEFDTQNNEENQNPEGQPAGV